MSRLLAQVIEEYHHCRMSSQRPRLLQGREKQQPRNLAERQYETHSDTPRSLHTRLRSPVTDVPAVKYWSWRPWPFFIFPPGIQATSSLLLNSAKVCFPEPIWKIPLEMPCRPQNPLTLLLGLFFMDWLPVCVPNHQRKPVLVKNDSWNVSLTTFYIRRWTCRF